MNDLAARLKAKGYASHKNPAFLTGVGVRIFSLDEDKTMTEQQRQRIRVVLAEAIEALKAIDPHLDANSLERSSLARHCLRRVLREMNKPEGAGDA